MNWEELLKKMEEEALKRNAPVLTLKSHTSTPFKALVAVLLSSRTKDEITLEVTKRLFRLADTPEKILRLSLPKLESLIYPVGFYKIKAKKLKELANILVEQYSSKVPSNYTQLIKLPGIGRKSANVVLSQVFNRGVIAVDTHVHRVSNRIGLVKTKKPAETEAELERLVPNELKTRVNEIFVAFGQSVCKPIKPLCNECPLSKTCPKVGV